MAINPTIYRMVSLNQRLYQTLDQLHSRAAEQAQQQARSAQGKNGVDQDLPSPIEFQLQYRNLITQSLMGYQPPSATPKADPISSMVDFLNRIDANSYLYAQNNQLLSNDNDGLFTSNLMQTAYQRSQELLDQINNQINTKTDRRV